MSQTGPENPLYQLQGANRAGGEEPKTTEPRKSSLEMRLHPRLYAALAMKCQVIWLEAEKSWDGAGTLKNISFGGVYFTCDDPLPLELGQVRNFSLNPATPGEKLRWPSRLSARGLVVRVERPAPDQAVLGIAVKFLTPLQLSPA
jgi:hypothetical protein